MLPYLFSRERVPRYYGHRSNALDLPDKAFISKYRLDKFSFLYVCDVLSPELQRGQNGLSVELQVLSTLRLLGSGSFQAVIGDDQFLCLSQPTISRNVSRVCEALFKCSRDYIKFPETASEILAVKQGFFSSGGLPNTLGIIDCTHVLLQRPHKEDWFVYINRKGKFSINVQLVCDAEYRILSAICRWPGSTHDSFIWRFSGLREKLQSAQNGYLLGDSGYPLEPWLLTPYLHPQTQAQENYNQGFKSIRAVIEQTNGILKSRFRCLHETGGIMCYQPEKVCTIVMACCVLHNICNERKVPMPPDEERVHENLDEQSPYDDRDASAASLRQHASRLRDDLALRYFS